MSLRQWFPLLTLCVLATVSMMLLYYTITEPLPPETLSSQARDPFKVQPLIVSNKEPLIVTNKANTHSLSPIIKSHFRKVRHTKQRSQNSNKLNKMYRYNTIRDNIHNQRTGGFRPLSLVGDASFKRSFINNPNKEAYKYCNVSHIPSLSKLLKQHNKYSDKLTANKIEQLKQLRLKKPVACHQNRTHLSHLNKLNIDLDDDNNLVPFINRCKVKSMRDQPDLYEYYGHRSSRMAYMHIFKSGGSTVMQTWDNILEDHPHHMSNPQKVHRRFWSRKLPKELKWMIDRDYFYENIFNKQYIFSFVRDPLTRFLSGFFEYIVRGNDNVEKEYMEFMNNMLDKYDSDEKKALHLLSELARIMEHRMKCEYYSKYYYRDANDAMNAYSVNTLGIYWDDHLVPQMHFLLDDEWQPYTLNYVGYVQNMEHSMFNMFKEYLNLHADSFTFEKYKESYYYHARDRHNEEYQTAENQERKSERFLKKQRIDISGLVLEANQLSEELTQLICNLYWLDYICLPFDIPPQCNLTELYLQHYGSDVVYRECYQ